MILYAPWDGSALFLTKTGVTENKIYGYYLPSSLNGYIYHDFRAW